MPPARDEQAGQTERFTWPEDRQGPRAYAATPTGSCMQVPHRHERLGLETTPVRHTNGQQARKDGGKNTKTKNGSRSEEVQEEHKEKEEKVLLREKKKKMAARERSRRVAAVPGVPVLDLSSAGSTFMAAKGPCSATLASAELSRLP